MINDINLIGINGKIGHGKDTVAEIIKRLSYKSWEIKKFAGKLKQIASLLTGIPVEKFEDQEFKKTKLNSSWSRSIPFGEPARGFKIENMTVRELLQKLGTEAIRNNLHENAWVNALFADFWGSPEPNWLISDVRFPNEAREIIHNDGIVIRVIRPGVESSDHPSETSLDDWKFDYVIENNGTLEELEEKVKMFMMQIGLL